MSGPSARGFPAFPARRGGTRGRSWWAREWVAAMEDTSLDLTELRRGRRLAGSGLLGPITVSPGRITTVAEDPDEQAVYVVAVTLAVLDEAGRARFLDRAAAEAGHLAALLAGEVPRELVRAAAAADVALLPGIGDLEGSCGCPDWGDPCRHAAALCYQVSWLLDADPFLLLLARGLDRETLLAELAGRDGPAAGPARRRGRGRGRGTSGARRPRRSRGGAGPGPARRRRPRAVRLRPRTRLRAPG
ncbi:MAG: SWIM zinc finger family protein [Pseudonocardia sp.]|nr:SWIM zinc finger family protein [Pseudonocardia sp.]